MTRPGVRDDGDAAAGVVGAVLLFGIFVTLIALVNVVHVPEAGLGAEAEHHGEVLDALAGVQSLVESTSSPGMQGATGARAFPLAPAHRPGQDALSFFVAKPARAAGELLFEPDHGNLTLLHYRDGVAEPVVDVGRRDAAFPTGRLVFDPHPVFREAGTVGLENGAVVTADAGAAAVRFAPPVSVSVDGATTRVTVKARVLTGDAVSLGGSTTVHLGLETQVATLHAPTRANAERVVLRVETAHGSAWGAHLNATSEDAGLTAGAGYATTVERGAGAGGLDVVTWTVHGTGTGNDVVLTHGLSVHRVRVS